MKKTLFIAGALMLLIPALAGAQALPYTAAETEASGLARAGACLAATSDVSCAAFSNAAAVPFAESSLDVSAGYTLWQPSAAGSNIIGAAGAYNIKDRLGVALGFRYGINPSYEVTGSSGSSAGTFTPSDMQLSAGLGWRFLPFLSVGATVGYASSSLAEGHSVGTVTSDVFVMASLSGFRAAIGVSNLGGSVTSAGGAKFSLPTSAAVGAGYGRVFADRHGIDVTLDADCYFSGAFSAAVGAEYTYGGMVSVRAGYRYGGKTVLPSFASVGAGVRFAGARLDLAYVIASGPMKNTLALSLGYSF